MCLCIIWKGFVNSNKMFLKDLINILFVYLVKLVFFYEVVNLVKIECMNFLFWI